MQKKEDEMHDRLDDLKEEEVCQIFGLIIVYGLWRVFGICKKMNIWWFHGLPTSLSESYFKARMADYKKSKRLEQKKRKNPEVQVDEEVAAAMGFGGFGTSKKQ